MPLLKDPFGSFVDHSITNTPHHINMYDDYSYGKHSSCVQGS